MKKIFKKLKNSFKKTYQISIQVDKLMDLLRSLAPGTWPLSTNNPLNRLLIVR